MVFNIKDNLDKNEDLVYQNKFVYVTEEPSGKGFNYVRVYLEPSVHIFAIDESDRIWMINEYRPLEKRSRWLIPSGSIDNNETPEEAAQRELQEELGFKADYLELLCKKHYQKKTCNELKYYFIARGLTEVDIENPDGDVILSKKQVTIEELVNYAVNDMFGWSDLVIAIMKLNKRLK